MSEERQNDTDPAGQASEAEDEQDGWDDRLKGTAKTWGKAFGKRVRSVLDQETIRNAVSESMPKELLGYLMKSVDAGKDEVVRVTGVQIRKFLENLDIGGELQKVLTSVSFEVRTTVRFVPNEDNGKSVRPDSEVAMSLQQGDREVEVNASPGRVKAMREGLRSAVDSAFKTFGGDEEEEGEVRKRWNAMRSGLFAAVDTVTSTFDRDDQEEPEATEVSAEGDDDASVASQPSDEQSTADAPTPDEPDSAES